MHGGVAQAMLAAPPPPPAPLDVTLDEGSPPAPPPLPAVEEAALCELDVAEPWAALLVAPPPLLLLAFPPPPQDRPAKRSTPAPIAESCGARLIPTVPSSARPLTRT